jgi:hypothetical protein
MRTDDLKSVILYGFGSFATNEKIDIAVRLSQSTAKVSAYSARADD